MHTITYMIKNYCNSFINRYFIVRCVMTSCPGSNSSMHDKGRQKTNVDS